jgi:hypothetical protein
MKPPAGWSSFSTLNAGECSRAHAVRTQGSYPQPTAVVRQLSLELVKVKALRPAGSDGADEKAAFLGLAAYLMKQC